jgi:hypothetical protein
VKQRLPHTKSERIYDQQTCNTRNIKKGLGAEEKLFQIEAWLERKEGRKLEVATA